MDNRIGIGYDIHRLVKGRPLRLGGIEVPHTCGLLGHSDGDVLLHAVCDAVLGALAAGDIGEHFPDTDPAYKNFDSQELLARVIGIAAKRGFTVLQVDTVLIVEKPKLLKYKLAIQLNVARLLRVSKQNVGIKAKTNEGLGDVGRGKAMAAYAVAVLQPVKKRTR
jgi:2-C-methyl-D-erythritol 2,4-cyclodiphosphate synthase